MPDMAPRTSAIAGHVHAGEHGALGPGGPGVTLVEMRPCALCQINGAPPVEDIGRRLTPLGVAGTPEARRACEGEGVLLLWNGPGQWLAVSTRHAPRELLTALRDALAGSDATVTDLSHSRTIVRVSGPRAVDVLAKGCPLDLEAMRAGDSATSLLGHLTAHLHCLGDAGFDVYVYRSFGLALWEQLVEGALEYGLLVTPGTD